MYLVSFLCRWRMSFLQTMVSDERSPAESSIVQVVGEGDTWNLPREPPDPAPVAGSPHEYVQCFYCHWSHCLVWWDEIIMGMLTQGTRRNCIKQQNHQWFVPGHLRLADFGLSRRLERGGRAFTICGTIQYMGEEEQEQRQLALTLGI